MQKVVLLLESDLMLVLLSLVRWQRYQRPVKRWWQNWRAKPKRTRTMRPRTPDDCQDCRLAAAETGPSRSQARRAWKAVKSQRGRPKIHDSRGQAGMNPACEYYKDPDPDCHTLRWDGRRNV